MVGIIPYGSKTYEVIGPISDGGFIEGKIYWDRDEHLYMYSTIHTRSCPETGYFPIYNGKRYTSFTAGNQKFLKDVIRIDLTAMASQLDDQTAKNVVYKRRKRDSDKALKPEITDEDNMFTQCIKGCICAMDLGIIDLYDMAAPILKQSVVDNYYASLVKITFMRMNKWHIWVEKILHLTYTIECYRGNRILVRYEHPDKLDTGSVNYSKVYKAADDPLKRMIKILIVMENITKADLKSEVVDDYTINNLMTTLNSDKPLSAQLFSRFMRMSGIGYRCIMYRNGEVIFTYKEG